MSIQVGLSGTATVMVTGADTAQALGSGDVEVYGTPAVVTLCERAAVAALAGHLEGNDTSVGVRVEIDHLAPTVPGVDVTAVAQLRGIDGRKLRFEIEVTDPAGTVARAIHTRVVVDRDRFMHGAEART